MDSKKFVFRSLLYSALIITSIGLLNFFLDPFGLFFDKPNRKIEVYTNERTSKYLLSFNYIPKNFEGFIVGPSLSDNLNPLEIPEFKIYNASIKGANISELRYLVNNIVEKGKPKFAIICLDPYLTKDHGKKSAMIDPKEYYGALGSYNLLITYLFKFVKEFELLPSKFPKGSINEAGYNNFNLSLKDLDSKKLILEKVKKLESEPTQIDTIAYREFKETLELLRNHNVKLIAYFNPVPFQIREIDKKGFDNFQFQMGKLFKPADIIINLNAPEYYYFTQDYANYSDQGHLSYQGQKFVTSKLREVLLVNFKPSR